MPCDSSVQGAGALGATIRESRVYQFLRLGSAKKVSVKKENNEVGWRLIGASKEGPREIAYLRTYLMMMYPPPDLRLALELRLNQSLLELQSTRFELLKVDLHELQHDPPALPARHLGPRRNLERRVFGVLVVAMQVEGEAFSLPDTYIIQPSHWPKDRSANQKRGRWVSRVQRAAPYLVPLRHPSLRPRFNRRRRRR
jgi:hypothetical protein